VKTALEALKPMSRKHRRLYRNSPIAESIIHAWVGETQFNRGLKYIDQHLLHRQHRRGNSIRATCEGKRNGTNFYKVRVEVIEGRIDEANCSCSIGKHGVCPHIAAMLVEYSRMPERYVMVSFFGKLKAMLGLG
jgi:uncharacterized Zn finger protein